MSELITAKAINSTLGTSNFRSLDTLLGEDIQVLSQKLDRVNANLESRTWRYALPPFAEVESSHGSYMIGQNQGQPRYDFRAVYAGHMYLKVSAATAGFPSLELHINTNGEDDVHTITEGHYSESHFIFDPQYFTLTVRQDDLVAIYFNSSNVVDTTIELHADFVSRPLNVIEEV